MRLSAVFHRFANCFWAWITEESINTSTKIHNKLNSQKKVCKGLSKKTLKFIGAKPEQKRQLFYNVKRVITRSNRTHYTKQVFFSDQITKHFSFFLFIRKIVMVAKLLVNLEIKCFVSRDFFLIITRKYLK